MKRLLCLFLLIVLTGCSTLNVNYPEMQGYTHIGSDSPEFENLKRKQVSWGYLEGYYFKDNSYSEQTDKFSEYAFIKGYPRTDRRPVPDSRMLQNLNNLIPYINDSYTFWDLHKEETAFSWLKTAQSRKDLEGYYLVEKADRIDKNYLAFKVVEIEKGSGTDNSSNEITLYAVRVLPLKGQIYDLVYVKKAFHRDHLFSIDASIDAMIEKILAAN